MFWNAPKKEKKNNNNNTCAQGAQSHQGNKGPNIMSNMGPS